MSSRHVLLHQVLPQRTRARAVLGAATAVALGLVSSAALAETLGHRAGTSATGLAWPGSDVGLSTRAQQAIGSAPDAALIWPRLQARLLTVPLAALPTNARLGPDPGVGLGRVPAVMGDLYFSSSLLGPRVLGGFRATSGWMLSSQALATDGLDAALDAPSGRSLAPGSSALPYLGLGYSGVSPRGGWGVSADIGVMAANPGALRAGRQWQNAQAVEDMVRELRLTPLVRLGVSYEF